MTNRTRSLALAAVLALASLPAIAADTIGSKLADRGYSLARCVAQPNAPGSFACQWGRCLIGDFNPSVSYTGTALSSQARWGIDPSSNFVKGNTVGERLGDLTCAAQTLGLPAGYVVTLQDINDARVLVKIGSLIAAWDFELSAMTCGGNPPPVPACSLPAVCMVPPAPCATCPVCPTCPPPPPSCAPMPAFVRAQIAKAPEWSGILTPGRKRALAAIKAWAASCP